MANTSTTTVTTDTQKNSKFSEFMNKSLFGSEKLKMKHAVIALGAAGTVAVAGGVYFYTKKKQD